MPTWGWIILGWAIALVIVAPLIGRATRLPYCDPDEDWP